MRSLAVLLPLALAGCATTGGGGGAPGWSCAAQSAEGPVRAGSVRALGSRGELRSGRTDFDLNLAGTAPARLLAEWQAEEGVLEIAEGRFRFRMSPGTSAGEPGQLVLAGGTTTYRSRAFSPGLSELAVSGRDLAALLASRAPLRLVRLARDGRELGSAPVDRSTFDLALERARQADAAALASAADYRRLCQREERIIPT
ncbi:hypothetical protein GCM10022280_00320 [Sphingomonas swuensis]|uniref:Uncharacterized protein n=1 Tax=Sphingomonas swuensis TaxID=977800 RepID=A0ABP7S855_9SPHN